MTNIIGTLNIEKNVPLPEGVMKDYNWGDLKITNSFLISLDEERFIAESLQKWNYNNVTKINLLRRFIREEGKIRFWRI
jgi:ribosomal protein S18